MYTSYEQRFAMLDEFAEGSFPFVSKMTNAVIEKNDGWNLMLGDSNIASLNGASIYTSRKETVDELLAAFEKYGRSANIRLVGPGVVHLEALQKHGFKNYGGVPFMMWVADDSMDSFTLRDGLTVRQVTPDDLPVMREIYREVYEMADEELDVFQSMFFAASQANTYGLFKEDEMVSIVTAMVHNDTVGIWNMGTPNAHQKNGYGLQLLSYVMKTHKNLGAKRLYLHSSTAGKFLYDKAGWITLDYFPYLAKAPTE
jgi:N-acetylglutamate synthase-like GNAT family acetyltransferase